MLDPAVEGTARSVDATAGSEVKLRPPTTSEAMELVEELDKEIVWRVRQYAKCVGHVTANYKEWLIGDYKSKLAILVKKMMHRKELRRMAS